ncbi:MAG TPA: DUF1707 domain-containing protein [Solirubrobacteraceae bacterium]
MTRASDADRERALRALRRHYAAGRLDAAELEERADRAARARYRNELRALFVDLPGGVRAGAAKGAAARVDRAMLRAHAGAYATVNAAMVGIWALTGGGDFWPAWTIGPWGAALAGHAWCSRALRRALGRGPRRRQLAR